MKANMVGASQLMGLPVKVPWTSRRPGSNGGIRMKNIQCAAAPPNWAVSLCDFLETKIYSSDPSFRNPGSVSYLSGMFEPVQEMAPTTHLHVTGTIPECLNGEFMRVGPNPRFTPRGGHNWLDGDGMIHGIRLKNGKATYVARYVQTHRLQQEEHYGGPKFLRMGDLKGMKGVYCLFLEALRRISGITSSSGDAMLFGGANTALVYHNKKLLALQDGDKPYIIKVLEDGDLQTLGAEDFEHKLHSSFGPHPKIDPETGEMFTIAHSQKLSRQMIYHVVSKEGVLREPGVLVTSNVMHDFAITKNYAVFMDLPLGIDLLGMAKGEFALQFQSTKECRIGVLPRYATDDSDIRWFTIPTCFIFHTLNAWEEEGEVVLICCRMDDINLETFDSVFQGKVSPELHEYRLNLQTGVVKERQLSNLPVEFPRVNPDYTGRKMRYAYCYTGNEKTLTGVAKFDFTKMERPLLAAAEGSNPINDPKAEDNLAGLYVLGQKAEGRVGGDTVFVPRHPGNAKAEEDDGYLITYVLDNLTGKSEAIIIDAKTMGPEPVAVVELPRRVPYGLHAHFITQEELEQQLA